MVLMDLLKLIIDAERLTATCFLCFKLCDDGINIYENIDMQDTSHDFAVKTSLLNLIKYLFPLEDTLFSKACNDCVEDLKKIYFKLQVRSLNMKNLELIVDIISNNISGSITGDCRIMVASPLLSKHTNNDAINNGGNINNEQTNYLTCNFNSTSKDLLNEHKQILNTKSQSEICHICGKNCRSSKALQSHLNCHNIKECPYCMKVLKTHSHFNKHIKGHQANVERKRKRKYHSCNSCSYKTCNEIDLQSHKNKAHLKIRPYQCEICLKSFHKNSNLTSHKLCHNKKKLMCEICGNSFSFKKTLIHHLKLHEGVRDYECEFCKRKFVTPSRKNEHIKRNHSNMYYYCPCCEKKYSLKKDLNTHLKKIHCDIILTSEKIDIH